MRSQNGVACHAGTARRVNDFPGPVVSLQVQDSGAVWLKTVIFQAQYLLLGRLMESDAITLKEIEAKIHLIRSMKVILDADLAQLYGVTTFNLNKAVKRNAERFPSDFMFQLTDDEVRNLRFQIGISSSRGWGGRRFNPFAFTQEGIAMLSSVLKSDRAVQMNIAIMRVFVHLRELLVSHEDLSRRIDALENLHAKKFKVVFDAIRELMSNRPVPRKRIIGLGEKD